MTHLLSRVVCLASVLIVAGSGLLPVTQAATATPSNVLQPATAVIPGRALSGSVGAVATDASAESSGSSEENKPERSDTLASDLTSAPLARKEDKVLRIGSHDISDPFFWMRDDSRKNPQVQALIEQENHFTEAYGKAFEPLQQQLLKELKAHVDHDVSRLPYPHGGYYYSTKRDKGQKYAIHIRGKELNDQQAIKDPQVVLDLNSVAEVFGSPKFMHVRAVTPSPDHNLVAFSVDTTGYETYDIRIRAINAGVEAPADRLDKTAGHVQWGQDASSLYYTTNDATQRAYRLYYHKVGTPQSTDVLLYEESDKNFELLGVTRSRSGRFIFIKTTSKSTTDVLFVDLNAKEVKAVMFQPRQDGLRYTVDHHGNHFYARTNENAINFKLVRTPIEKLDKSNWEVVVDHDPAFFLEDMPAFKGFIILVGRQDGLTNMRALTLPDAATLNPPAIPPSALNATNNSTAATNSTSSNSTGAGARFASLHQQRVAAVAPASFAVRPIVFTDKIYTVHLGPNLEFDTPQLRLVYSTPVDPPRVLSYHVRSYEVKVLRSIVVPGYDPSLYATDRVFATAADGTKVPISLVFRKDKRKPAGTDGGNPVFMTAYGAYGKSTDPEWRSTVVPLLDRGVVYAVAHVRGGGEYGPAWYHQAKLERKVTTFNDFIACAQHLVDSKWTAPKHLAIEGGSAGGLLMGAVTNMRPDLFRAVIARVPFVDVLGSMSDASIPETTLEYLEWGNPAIESQYAVMASYSPYENVKNQQYPAILATTALHDAHVGYWEPLKWVHKLRYVAAERRSLASAAAAVSGATASSGATFDVLYKCKMQGGHGKSSGVSSRVEDVAFNYAFALHAMGITA